MTAESSPEAILRTLDYMRQNLSDKNHLPAQQVKRELITTVGADILNSGDFNDGYVLHGGSEANEIALWYAKIVTKKNTVIVSNLAHASIAVAAKKLSMNCIVVNANPDTLQVDPQKIIEHIQSNSDIACVSATYGTTQFGSDEKFILHHPLVALCKERDIHIHLDAAYGGFIKTLLNRSFLDTCLSVIDSITVDPHKFLGVMGCGLLLLRGKKTLHQEVQYFSGADSFLGTTRSAFPCALAVDALCHHTDDERIKIANDCLHKAKLISHAANLAGYKTAPVESGVVTVLVNNQNIMQSVLSNMQLHGYSLSPVTLTGSSHILYGIRTVITPRREFDVASVLDFCRHLYRELTAAKTST